MSTSIVPYIPKIVSDTRANILSLQSANNLIVGTRYCATDITCIPSYPGSFCTVALASNSLSTVGTFEAPAWNPGKPYSAVLNWVTGNLSSLFDSTLMNQVFGELSITQFPWNVIDVYNNTISHCTITYSGTSMNNVTALNAVLDCQNAIIAGCAIRNQGKLFMNGGVINNSFIDTMTECRFAGTPVDIRGAHFNERTMVTSENSPSFIFKDGKIGSLCSLVLSGSKFESLSSTLRDKVSIVASDPDGQITLNNMSVDSNSMITNMKGELKFLSGRIGTRSTITGSNTNPVAVNTIQASTVADWSTVIISGTSNDNLIQRCSINAGLTFQIVNCQSALLRRIGAGSMHDVIFSGCTGVFLDGVTINSTGYVRATNYGGTMIGVSITSAGSLLLDNNTVRIENTTIDSKGALDVDGGTGTIRSLKLDSLAAMNVALCNGTISSCRLGGNHVMNISTNSGITHLNLTAFASGTSTIAATPAVVGTLTKNF